MKRMLPLLLLAALLVPAFSCAEKKSPERTALESKNVLTALRDLSAAYEKKDRAAFMDSLDRNFRDREHFAEKMEALFSKYETIHFSIEYTRMIITIERNGPIEAVFNWNADWATAGGSTQKDGGRATLDFDPNSFKLLSIEGKNPFVPHPAEIPGRNE